MSVVEYSKSVPGHETGLFRGVLIVSACITISATVFAVSGFGPIGPASRWMLVLLLVNTLIIAGLVVMLSLRYRQIRQERKRDGAGRLASRFTRQFALAAILPAIVVALFLGVTITRGINNWFGDRVRTVVEEAASNARATVDGIADDIRIKTALMAADLSQADAINGLTNDSERYALYLAAQASLRDFPEAFVLNSDGVVLSSTNSDVTYFVPPTPNRLTDAQAGDVVVTLFDDAYTFKALYQLEAYKDAYLYVTRPVSKSQIDSLRAAESALADYREAERRSTLLQVIFAISFTQIAALILLLAVRWGLNAAQEVSQPIGRLARAAERVSSGDFNVQVEHPGRDNEVAQLTESFNRMTSQLRTQREDLERERYDAEKRSKFIEAVLSGVSAGVMRIDHDETISLVNESAHNLLRRDEDVHNRQLSDIAPEFAPVVLTALADGKRSEGSVFVSLGGEKRQFLVIAAPEEAGGCVLTFDDTTRLIFAQRQTAWRDVARRIAHEIRNPLTPVQLSAERLKRRYRKYIPEDDTVFDRCTDTILRQVQDIGRMVEEFSNFARMPKPSLEPFDLTLMLNDIVFSQRLTVPNVSCNASLPTGPLVVRGDDRLLAQAFVNLIKNAAESVQRRFNEVPPGDNETAWVEVGVEADDSHATITVEDNGNGFPKSDRERLLEPYVTTREQGVGLGLAIVHRIIQDHGGSVRLTDRDDGQVGARVVIQLPLNGPTDEIVSTWGMSEENV